MFRARGLKKYESCHKSSVKRNSPDFGQGFFFWVNLESHTKSHTLKNKKSPEALRIRGFIWWGWWDLNPPHIVHRWTENTLKPLKNGH